MKLLRQITDMDIIGDDKLSKANPRYTARAILIDSIGDIAVMYSKKHLLHSLPGGGIEENEDQITAVKREILEETGCDCEIIRDLGYVYENRAHSDFTQYSYYYIDKVIGNKGIANLTQNEVKNGTGVEWHDLNTAIRLISTPTHKTLQQKFIQCKDSAALNELVLTSKGVLNLLNFHSPKYKTFREHQCYQHWCYFCCRGKLEFVKPMVEQLQRMMKHLKVDMMRHMKYGYTLCLEAYKIV